jgi:hypothetical protein
VIGVEVAKGTVFGIPQDSFIILPLKTYAVNYGGLLRQRSLYFVATSRTDDSFNDAVEESRFLMRARRKLQPNEKDNFGIVTPDAITGLRDRIFGTIFIVAMLVPGIALIVGAIVIMNIMLVSVTERTKEIGIKKVAWRTAVGHLEAVPGGSSLARNTGRRCWNISRVACWQSSDSNVFPNLSLIVRNHGSTSGVRWRRCRVGHISRMEGRTT